jgi:hypothetical protein
MSRLIGLRSLSANSPLPVGSLRVRVVAGAVGVLALIGTGVLALAAVFSHRAFLGKAALGALIIGVFANGIVEICRGYSLWRMGAWAGLSGQRCTREQQPTGFVIWLTAHLLIAMVWIGAAAYLTGSLVQRL